MAAPSPPDNRSRGGDRAAAVRRSRAHGPKELDVALDRSSPEPLYLQLAEAIESAIASGELAPGDRLENEVSMTTRLGLARPTARQAIGELVRKGLVVRKRGVGTQVLGGRISRETRLSSLYDDLQNSGRQPTTRLLSFRIGPPTEAAQATGVELGDDSEFIVLRRLRMADGVPLAILTNHLPARLPITEEDLGSSEDCAGLYATLRARGIKLRVAHQTVGARLMTAEEAKLLGDRRPVACLTATRTVYDDDGRLVEIGQHVYRASHYSLEVPLVP
jgi:GntR family transcriptional regulator